MAIFLLVGLSFLIVFAGIGAGKDECMVTRCRKDGPEIRFPFRLKDHQPSHCGYPGFDLSCKENDTLLELQIPVKIPVRETELLFSFKAVVGEIYYESQSIHLYYVDGSGCPPRQLQNRNSSASPFKFLDITENCSYTLFNCSSNKTELTFPFTCLDSPGYQIYAVVSGYNIFTDNLASCRKMYDIETLPIKWFYYHISPVPYNRPYLYPYFGIRVNWSEPICANCEAQRKYCRLKNNNSSTSKHETECFVPVVYPTPRQPNAGASDRVVVAGVIVGVFLIVLFIVALYWVIRSDKIKKEAQVRIEKFLQDYKALKPTRYSYADIKKFTNHFSDKLGEGGYGTVYKGKLSNDILVAVKLLDNDSKGNGEEFINEVGTIGRIHHVNVVRLVGYCADGFRRALVYEFLPNNSLEKFVCSGNHKNHFLGWERLQQIALGIAKGIEYLHQGCAQRILHFDIKPHNILLDHNYNPKISDFGLAKLCSKGQSIVSMTAARGTMGYIAPEVFSRNFGNVSSKSDVYSFGMLLLELVGGRKNINGGEQNTSEVYFPDWIYDRLDKGRELGIHIEKEGDSIISKKLTIVGLWCIRWHPVDRPSMKVVIQMLEGEEIPTMPPNPFGSSNQTSTSAATHGKPFSSMLQVISESE